MPLRKVAGRLLTVRASTIVAGGVLLVAGVLWLMPSVARMPSPPRRLALVVVHPAGMLVESDADGFREVQTPEQTAVAPGPVASSPGGSQPGQQMLQLPGH